MSSVDLKRKLTAILAADVAGYSRLMAADERATVDALDTVHGICRKHIGLKQGRVVDMAGDSVLAVFETATGAVMAAMAIQQSMTTAFLSRPEPARMHLRIGLHLGDLFEKADGTVYGDGVNIAARLQAVAEPGGIVASGAVQSTVRGKFPADFVDAGEQQVKNIPYTVRAFQVVGALPTDAQWSEPAMPVTAPARIQPAGDGHDSWGTAARTDADRKRMKILLVDDHALFRDGLAELLKGLEPDVEIIQAGDADAAIAQAVAGSGIDMVLLDLYMPGTNGLALLDTFKKELPSVPVVVLSADETRNSVLRAIDKGAMGYIPKTATWAVMTQALRLVLAGGIYLPPAVLADQNQGRADTRPMPSVLVIDRMGQLNLTPRQLDVLRCLLRGMPNKIISRELGIAEGTIKTHVASVFSSLHVHNRTEAVIEASRRGLQLGTQPR